MRYFGLWKIFEFILRLWCLSTVWDSVEMSSKPLEETHVRNVLGRIWWEIFQNFQTDLQMLDVYLVILQKHSMSIVQISSKAIEETHVVLRNISVQIENSDLLLQIIIAIIFWIWAQYNTLFRRLKNLEKTHMRIRNVGIIWWEISKVILRSLTFTCRIQCFG